MAHPAANEALTGRQIHFPDDLLIVSKTDTRGVITHANHGFSEVAGYTFAELIGRPHNLVRHPDMPRSAFALMWETLGRQQEFFAYVVNRARNGDHYWVFAHVVPDIDPDTGATIGYPSARRWTAPTAIESARAVYRRLLEVEAREVGPQRAVAAGRGEFDRILATAGVTYEQWVFAIG
jgi:PAS domain S-box-containing protein